MSTSLTPDTTTCQLFPFLEKKALITALHRWSRGHEISPHTRRSDEEPWSATFISAKKPSLIIPFEEVSRSGTTSIPILWFSLGYNKDSSFDSRILYRILLFLIWEISVHWIIHPRRRVKHSYRAFALRRYPASLYLEACVLGICCECQDRMECHGGHA